MLQKIKDSFSPYEILKGNFGIEREALRVNKDGELSKNKHPEVFGDKIKNPYITTDFSESQIEMITPPLKSSKEVYDFANALYDIASMEINDELLWPQSMPCRLGSEEDIPLAEYSNDKKGNEAREYREKLIKKYGGKKQLICGIHYNFSFDEEMLKRLYTINDNKESYKEFKNSIYLKVTRNYLRYRWILIYLLGVSSIVDKSYKCGCNTSKYEINKDSYTNKGALSYRNSECGYKNKVELLPDYYSLDGYIKSLKSYISDNIIDSHKELYSSIRIKSEDPDNFFDSLSKDGIKYLEYRSIDINPFEKSGISLLDLEFLQIFNLYLLIKDENDYKNWQEESSKNADMISKFGQDDLKLLKDGKEVSKYDYALEIVNEIKNLNDELHLDKNEAINYELNKILDVTNTYAYKSEEIIKKKGYMSTYLDIAENYKKDSYNNRFKLQGFETLELSTQILMRESIKRGIKVDVIDKYENFICLKKGEKIEYVKQATKTSKDNYVTVLIMENKSVTKKVLRENNIRVPGGIEVNSIDEAESFLKSYINKPIVIKPKSTNFGTGISIFSDGTNYENMLEAIKIAFKHDNTVLIEEFIEGKEYRFLVIDDEVCGILHRVPANVIGDGVKSIRELVEIKNQDSLRGYHYVTPLEKIKLDENAELFLKNQNKNFDYIPKENETVYLRENSNISTGGDSIDYTYAIPDKFKEIAIKASKAVNAKICGVDMMIEDYRDENSNFGIIELNFNPAIHIHCYPYKGTERNIGKKVLKLLDLY